MRQTETVRLAWVYMLFEMRTEMVKRLRIMRITCHPLVNSVECHCCASTAAFYFILHAFVYDFFSNEYANQHKYAVYPFRLLIHTILTHCPQIEESRQRMQKTNLTHRPQSRSHAIRWLLIDVILLIGCDRYFIFGLHASRQQERK